MDLDEKIRKNSKELQSVMIKSVLEALNNISIRVGEIEQENKNLKSAMQEINKHIEKRQSFIDFIYKSKPEIVMIIKKSLEDK